MKAIKNIGSDRTLTLEVISRHWLMITGCKLGGHHNCSSDIFEICSCIFYFFKREFDGERKRKRNRDGERERVK